MIVVKIWQDYWRCKNMVINWRWFCFGLIVQKVPVFFTASFKCCERLNFFGQKKNDFAAYNLNFPFLANCLMNWCFKNKIAEYGLNKSNLSLLCCVPKSIFILSTKDMKRRLIARNPLRQSNNGFSKRSHFYISKPNAVLMIHWWFCVFLFLKRSVFPSRSRCSMIRTALSWKQEAGVGVC